MKGSRHGIILLGTACFVAMLAACNKNDAPTAAQAAGAAPSSTTPAMASVVPPAPASVARAPAPAATPTPVSQPKGLASYPLDGIKPIADNCSSATAVLTVTPKKVFDNWREHVPDWNWPSTVQALYAHPEFDVVSGRPTAPMQVQLLRGPHGDKNIAILGALRGRWHVQQAGRHVPRRREDGSAVGLLRQG